MAVREGGNGSVGLLWMVGEDRPAKLTPPEIALLRNEGPSHRERAFGTYREKPSLGFARDGVRADPDDAGQPVVIPLIGISDPAPRIVS